MGLSDASMALLYRHDFPGNIRELQNIIEYAFVLCRSGLIEPEHLPQELRERHPGSQEWTPETSMDELEARFLYEKLAQNRFNRAATARELGIHKTTLWRKMKKLGIQIPRR